MSCTYLSRRKPSPPFSRCEPGADLTDGSLSRRGKKSPRCRGYLFRAKNKKKETDYLHSEYLLKVISRSLLYKVSDTLADNLTFLLCAFFPTMHFQNFEGKGGIDFQSEISAASVFLSHSCSGIKLFRIFLSCFLFGQSAFHMLKIRNLVTRKTLPFSTLSLCQGF